MEERVYIHSETCCLCVVLDPHLIGGIWTCKVSCNGGGGGGGGGEVTIQYDDFEGGTIQYDDFERGHVPLVSPPHFHHL